MKRMAALLLCAALTALLARCTPHPPAATEPPAAPAPVEQPKSQPAQTKPLAKSLEKTKAPLKSASSAAVLPQEKKPEAAAKRPETGPYRYNVVDSASMGNEIILTKDKILMEDEPAGDTAADTSLSDDGVSKRYKITQGYRIQVYATTNFKDAEKKKEDLLSVIDDPIYVVYDPPYYKIRAGNFVKEDQAKDLKKVLEEMGNDAWVVQSKIRVRTDDEPKKKKSR